MNSEADDSPFGSIVKFNRASSVYRIESDQETESDIVQIRLKHTKFNPGRKQADRGIEVEFVNEEDALVKVYFREFDPAENEKYQKTLPDWQVIQHILRTNGGALECHEIATLAKEANPDTRIDAKRAFNVMDQKKKVFIKVDGVKKWGLLQ